MREVVEASEVTVAHHRLEEMPVWRSRPRLPNHNHSESERGWGLSSSQVAVERPCGLLSI